MATVYPRRHWITVEEFERMGEAGIFAEDERVELIEGEIFEMAPVRAKHAECLSRLVRIFVKGSEALVRVQDPIRLSEQSEPQRDFALVKNQSCAQAHPGLEDVLLLIEMADASLAYDRTVKLSLYARYGIPEVWLVDLSQSRIEVYPQPSPSGYLEVKEAKPGERLSAIFCHEVTLEVEKVLG